MSEVKVPVVRVEIFRGVGFADDNFVKAWTKITGGTSTFTEDGEYAYLAKGDQPTCEIEKSFANLNSNVYKYLQIRVAVTNAAWQVLLFDGAVWDVIMEKVVPGIFEAALPINKIYSKIRLKTMGDTDFNYVFITKDTMLTPAVDLAETAEITLPLLEMGVSGAKFVLPNNNAEYTGKIAEYDRIIVWLYRAGETAKKIFGGIISDYAYRGRQENYWIDIDCLGLGQQLHSPVSLVQKIYSATNGRTIIKESIDTECPTLTDKFVDVDNEIASTHDLELDEAVPYSLINEICRKATTTVGVVGFDGYIDSAGNLHVFKRGKYISPVDLAGKILSYDRKIDAHRIKNKIKVYGKPEKSHPLDKDAWTESLVDWVALPNVTLTLVTSPKYFGTYSIKIEAPNLSTCGADKVFPEVKALFDKDHKQLIFALCTPDIDLIGDFKIYLFDYQHSIDHMFVKNIGKLAKNNEWQVFTLPLGPTHEKPAEPDGWRKYGSPDWNRLARFSVRGSLISGTRSFNIDYLHFFGARFSAVVEDSASTAKYDVRMAESQIYDELKSDNECQKKAKSLINFLKEKIESLTVITDGDNRFTPGDRQRVVIPNDNLDAFYRILEVRHVLSDVTWDTFLKLSNEPKIIDYIFASTAAPRYAGVTVVVPRDFSTIQEGIDALVIH